MNKRKWTDEEFLEAVKTSISKSDVLKKLGLTLRPGNFRTFEKYVKLLNADISHFKGKAHGTTKIVKYTIEELLVENSTNYNSSTIKRRLLSEGIIKHVCDICDLKEWNGKPLIMVLDHINGIHTDYRRENLRMLCPNCNSQQETFCRKTKINRH